MKKRIQFGTLLITVLLLFGASASAAEPEKNLRDKHNPDQHKDVPDGQWYTMYFEPGDTDIYVTCNGVPPNPQDKYQIGCKTPAVWAWCEPDNDGGLGPYTFCNCTSDANKQHSGQYQLKGCK